MLTPGGLVLYVGGGGPSGHVMDWSRLLLAAARERDLRVVVADQPANLATVPVSENVRTLELDWRHDDDVVRLAVSLRDSGLAAVVGFREFSLHATAAAAAACDLPWNPVRAVEWTRDKWRCRQMVGALGFRQPQSLPCKGPGDVSAALVATKFPAIVKPRSAYGSQGVSVIDSAREAPYAIARAMRYSDEFLVEEFVAGEEFSAHGVFVSAEPQLLAIHRKRVVGGGSFVETGHQTADDLDPTIIAEVRRTLRVVLPALGLSRSIFNVEFWTTNEGIVLGEAHARTGGDWVHRLVLESSGVDVFAHVLDDLMGTAHTPPEHLGLQVRSAAAVSAAHSMPGRVEKIEGIAEICDTPELLALDIAVTRGSVIGPTDESADRAGLIVARSPRGTRPGMGGAAAAEVADRLAAALNIITRPATVVR